MLNFNTSKVKNTNGDILLTKSFDFNELNSCNDNEKLFSNFIKQYNKESKLYINSINQQNIKNNDNNSIENIKNNNIINYKGIIIDKEENAYKYSIYKNIFNFNTTNLFNKDFSINLNNLEEINNSLKYISDEFYLIKNKAKEIHFNIYKTTVKDSSLTIKKIIDYYNISIENKKDLKQADEHLLCSMTNKVTIELIKYIIKYINKLKLDIDQEEVITLLTFIYSSLVNLERPLCDIHECELYNANSYIKEMLISLNKNVKICSDLDYRLNRYCFIIYLIISFIFKQKVIK